MTRLTILYDPDCFLCANSRRWMQDQETDFELGFIPLYDPEIRRRYPGFRPSPGELTAIREDGAAYLGSSAWLACLYAVADTRDLALRLSDSGLAFLARTAFRILTEKRPEPQRERDASLGIDLRLIHVAHIVFDWIFDGDDVHVRLVQDVHNGVECGGLPRTCGAADKYHAIGLF